MKKSVKIILWIIGISALIILPDANLYYQRYKLKAEKLPRVYEKYNPIYNLVDDTYEVLSIGGGFYNPAIQLNDSIIMIVYSASKETKDGSREEQSSYYKINLKGQITDSLKYVYNDRKQKHDYRLFKNHIIDLIDRT